ncbi:MAG: lysophospholipid acyltransferase family protein [Gallionella sp.]|nr:lysophospholipid acyltransferase family protein [Gallionella sp.]
MNHLCTVFRAFRLALHILYALAIAVSYPWLSLSLQRRILQSWSKELLTILGIRLLIDSDDALHAVDSGLIVTNHISWLDVFVLNAVVPMRFVAKSEVRTWPVIGWLCARAQTVFIERGKARSAARVNVQLVEMLKRGECLAVFPEGTTTDGAQVAHFHSSLLQPAIDAGVPVQAIALRYQDAYGQRSDAAAYIDEISFGESMWMILSARHLQVRLVAAAPMATDAADRRSLTQCAHQAIAASLMTLNEEARPSLHDVDHCTPSLHCLLLSPPLERELASSRH